MIDSSAPDTISQHLPADETLAARSIDCCKQIGELLAEVNGLAIRLRQRSRTLARDRSDLPGAEHVVLDILHRLGPLTVPQIARERSTSRQNIQILIDRLEGEGRVELIGNPAHSRSTLVRLTQHGKLRFDVSEKRQQDLLLEIGSSLSGSEVTLAASLLRKVNRFLSEGKQKGSARQTTPITRAAESREPKVFNLAAERETAPEEFPINLL